MVIFFHSVLLLVLMSNDDPSMILYRLCVRSLIQSTVPNMHKLPFHRSLAYDDACEDFSLHERIHDE